MCGPLLLVPAFVGKEFPAIKLTLEEAKFFSCNRRFVDPHLNTVLENIKEIPSRLELSIGSRIVFDHLFEILKYINDNSIVQYPKLSELIAYYRKVIIAAAIDSQNGGGVLEELPPEGESYTQTVLLEEGNYEILWSIPTASELIQKGQIELSTFTLCDLCISEDQINQPHLEKALSNNKPIIVVEYPMLPAKKVVIDGNHRVAALRKYGERTTCGYLLKPCDHVKAMPLLLSRVMFKVHYNIQQIHSFLAGRITYQECQLLPL